MKSGVTKKGVAKNFEKFRRVAKMGVAKKFEKFRSGENGGGEKF